MESWILGETEDHLARSIVWVRDYLPWKKGDGAGCEEWVYGMGWDGRGFFSVVEVRGMGLCFVEIVDGYWESMVLG